MLSAVDLKTWPNTKCHARSERKELEENFEPDCGEHQLIHISALLLRFQLFQSQTTLLRQRFLLLSKSFEVIGRLLLWEYRETLHSAAAAAAAAEENIKI